MCIRDSHQVDWSAANSQEARHNTECYADYYAGHGPPHPACFDIRFVYSCLLYTSDGLAQGHLQKCVGTAGKMAVRVNERRHQRMACLL